jgi:hypothetical protein
MRVQIARFQDDGWAVLLLYPEGARSFDASRELSPEGAAPEDVFERASSGIRRRPSGLARENRRLMDELLGGEE